MNVLVYGGRDFDDWARLFVVLDRLDKSEGPIDTIVHGGASGADTHGALWAKMNGRRSKCFPAQWGVYGRSAGPRRNQLMVDEGRFTVAVECPGGKGTADMRSRLLKTTTRIVYLDDE
jgi:hypothetical protein